MLTRAASRRQALRHVHHASTRIQLPWLCPALSHTPPVTTQRRTTTTRPALPRSRSAPLARPQARRLASAASVAEDFDHGDEYLPFAYERQRSSYFNVNDALQLDLSKILQIDTTTVRPPERLQSHTSGDMRGNSQEIEATLEACLQVQRWDRAFTILTQLRRLYSTNPFKLQQAYNRVLEAMVFDLIWSGNNQNRIRINKWIEVDMRQAGIDPNAQTFALKIKMALATMQGSRRDRTVTRYWEMAKDYQFENQVASLRNILSDTDLGKLSEICPIELDFDLQRDSGWDIEEPEIQVEPYDDNPTSTVRETDQKGLGLVALRQALSLFSSTSSVPEFDHTLDNFEQEAVARHRQSRLEQDSLESAMDRWKAEHEKRVKLGVGVNLTQGKVGAMLWQWHELLTQRINAELEKIDLAEASKKKSPEDRLRCEYGPFLRLLEPQKAAALTALSVIQTMSQAGVSEQMKLSRLVTHLGRVIESEIETQRSKDRKTPRKAARTTASQSGISLRDTPAEHASSQLHFQDVTRDTLRWSLATHAKVGAILCEMLFDVAKMIVTKEDKLGKKVSVAQPIFNRLTVYKHGRRVGMVTLHEAFREVLLKQPAADMIAKQLPMVSKPKKWTGFADGGYLESTNPVLRVKFDDVLQRDYARAAAERGDLDQLYKGLDVLGATGWRINKDVFSVMLEAWNSGEALANLPPVDKVFPNIPKPAEDAAPIDKWRFYSKMRAMDNEKSGLHSNRCFQNFQMEIAKAYLDETFYLPHNVDFRGRAYPMPPYLNQMGADNARGLLLFAEGRPLGSDGLRWLQVQLANVFGYDKASLTDRAQFAIDHLDDIRDSVNNPLNGRRWWLEAEDPWQCLAACHEILKALECEDPSQFISHLPVHQDGTCNGLQHYAALGGDIAGARQVNLEPGDKPADVYTGVAELVKAEIKQDVEKGVEIAKLLDGRITRKIVKQTVMTNVYGVTFTGAIRQVRKQVDDILPDLAESGKASLAATYIARKIFKGLGTLFEGAHEIQYWLGDCANRITHSISPAQLEQVAHDEFGDGTDTPAATGHQAFSAKEKKKKNFKQAGVESSDFRSSVIWTTPLKLPVVQPYRISHAQIVQTSLQGLALAEPSVADAVDSRKQLQGFPPNFVHSLDATHMMLSALKANEIGINFSAVHDSFWTHAADINTLNTLLRDAFIRMHSEDIVGRLAAEFKTRYNGHLYLAKIGRNNKLGKAIIKYRRDLAASTPRIKTGKKGAGMLKHKKYTELVREIKRNRLLASEDPAERAEGKNMVTASSLFEQYNGDKYLTSKVSLGQTAIGEVPDADPNAIEDALQAQPAQTDVNLQDTLEPLLPCHTADSTEAKQVSAVENTANRKRDSNKDNVWVWLPLTFRDVPKKGEWDIKRLKDSTYFFS